MMGTLLLAFANPLPSLHPLDLLVGLCCGAVRLAVYLRGKNAKKYRHGASTAVPVGAVQRISSHFKHQNLRITSS